METISNADIKKYFKTPKKKKERKKKRENNLGIRN